METAEATTLTVAHESDGCAGNFGASGVGDDAANGSGGTGGSEKDE
jgi:hypothetical protein